MTENEDAKHNLLLNIKRLEGMLERIDNFCHNYDQEKMDASVDRKSTRLNSSHSQQSRMPSSA